MKIVFDLDDTICETDMTIPYENRKPKLGVVEKLQEYKNKGFDIIICTGRQMRTYKGNIGKINVHTLPVIISWLNRWSIPYDEIYIGKPWEGELGFRVDDKAIRPREFRELTYNQIMDLIKKDK